MTRSESQVPARDSSRWDGHALGDLINAAADRRAAEPDEPLWDDLADALLWAAETAGRARRYQALLRDAMSKSGGEDQDVANESLADDVWDESERRERAENLFELWHAFRSADTPDHQADMLVMFDNEMFHFEHDTRQRWGLAAEDGSGNGS